MNTNYKRALLVGVLLSVMALCMVSIPDSDGRPAAATGSAEVDGVVYSTLPEAIQAARDGSTVTLLEDVVITPDDSTSTGIRSAMTIRCDMTIDLNGKKLTWDQGRAPTTSIPCFFMISDSSVVIEGNGIIDSEFGTRGAYGVTVMDGGSVTFKNGTFTGASAAAYAYDGHIIIEDGTFIQSKYCASAHPEWKQYVINVYDTDYKNGGGTVTITGGSFDFDYSKDPEGPNTSYLAGGYTATFINGLYHVAKAVDVPSDSDVVETTDDRISMDLGTKTDATINMSSISVTISGESSLENIVISAEPKVFKEAPQAVASYEISIVCGIDYVADITVPAVIPAGNQALVYYINSSGNLVPVEVVSYSSTSVTFRTDHTTPFVIMSEPIPVDPSVPDFDDDDDLPIIGMDTEKRVTHQC